MLLFFMCVIRTTGRRTMRFPSPSLRRIGHITDLRWLHESRMDDAPAAPITRTGATTVAPLGNLDLHELPVAV